MLIEDIYIVKYTQCAAVFIIVILNVVFTCDRYGWKLLQWEELLNRGNG